MEKHVIKSKFEQSIKDIYDLSYETEEIHYIVPAHESIYTPDFILETKSGKKIYLECKGYFDLEDRKKMELVIEQYPELDIRMVFQNPKIKISKTSKTTVAEWCNKKHIKWGTKNDILLWRIE